MSFFFHLSWHFKRQKPVFWKASFLQNNIQYSKQESLVFILGKVIWIYKSNRKLFSCVCIPWYKHSRGWENSRQLCKPSTSPRVYITVSNPPNPSRGISGYANTEKSFLLLKCIHVYKLSIISSSIEIILFNDIQIFAFPLYPYYQELLLFKKAREWGGGLIRGGRGRLYDIMV